MAEIIGRHWTRRFAKIWVLTTTGHSDWIACRADQPISCSRFDVVNCFFPDNYHIGLQKNYWTRAIYNIDL